MVITCTPLRISFFGGGTDYPVWYREHGGSVLATTINKCCYITCRRLPPFFEFHSRVSYSRVENVVKNGDILHPSVRACLQFMKMEEGVEIHHVADLPARTGLGTSSAFTVGLLLGLYALKNQMRDKHSLNADAIHVEQEIVEGGGRLAGPDQRCLRRIQPHQFRHGWKHRGQADSGCAQPLGGTREHLALFFTGFSRTASEIATEQVKITPHKKKELEAMLPAGG